MSQDDQSIIQVNLEDEMRRSYLDYAMSVIVGRALPDARDGLKPVHRRVLYAMSELGAHSNRPHYKSARIVGDVIGKYHPHGDQSVYDTLVRMAQPFSLRYMLADGQGNFGSVDGDSAAAMRYTEARMSRMAHELMADLDKETVDFQPNYDEKEKEPTVMPTRFPNLLINGTTGIAVGMATSIPPHNMSETIRACIALIDNPEISIADLMDYIPGPDFPTGGIINGTSGIINAYHTGRGRVRIRAKATVETNERGRESIVVTELPYQVNKARLIEKIAELVREKKIAGISELRDESDKDGMRVVIEVKRGDAGDIVLNNLYAQTQMENTFSINMVALVDGRPMTMNLKQVLETFVRHRRVVVTRRSIFELRKARERLHLLEGLTVALSNIDEVVEITKTSATTNEARQRLLERDWDPGDNDWLLSAPKEAQPDDLPAGRGMVDGRYRLTDVQATQILDMRLHRLTGLERDKIHNEYRSLLEIVQDLISILVSPDVLMAKIHQELEETLSEFGDERRSEIRQSEEDLDTLDLIPPEEVVVTMSSSGYVKRQSVSDYRAQRRGGHGRSAAATKEDDTIEQLWTVNTHDTLLVFTSAGRVFWLPVYQLPDAGFNSRGRPIVNWIALGQDEKVQAVLPVRDYSPDKYVLFATAGGTVKKTPLTEFAFRLARGKMAISLNEGDSLVGVALTNGDCDVLMLATNGKAVRFAESNVRSMGRTATGVCGMKLSGHARVAGMIAVNDKAVMAQVEGVEQDEETASEPVNDAGPFVLVATENGYGKRTPLSHFPRKGRATSGVIGIQTTDRNGPVVSVRLVETNDHVMLITDSGRLVRTQVEGISCVGRNTQGVTLIRLKDDERLQAVERIDGNLIPVDVPEEVTEQ